MHRDLKLENVILKEKVPLEECVLKIVDFGLASHCTVPDKYLFSRCGTPSWVSPEIINSSSKVHTKFTPKVDCFSAGVMLYVLLVGKSPFPGKTF